MKFRKLTSNRIFRVIVRLGGAFAAGALLSDPKGEGAAMYADVALIGALPLPWAAVMFAGSVVRSAVTGQVERSIIRLAAALMIISGRMFFEPSKPRSRGVLTGISLLTAGSAVAFLTGEFPRRLTFFLFHGGITAVTAACLTTVFLAFSRRKVLRLTGTSGTIFALAAVICWGALFRFEVLEMNIAIALGSAAVLMCAYHFRRTGGIAAGALVLCGGFLCSRQTGELAIFLPAAGFVAGSCEIRKPLAVSGIFALTGAVMLILTGASDRSVPLLAGICAGVLIFLLIADRLPDKWIELPGAAPDPELIRSRQNFLSDTIGGVRQDGIRIADKMSQSQRRQDTAEEIKQKVCAGCFRNPICWNSGSRRLSETFRNMADMTEFARESMPEELSFCLHRNELAEEFTRCTRDRFTSRLIDLRFMNIRSLIEQQMQVTESLVRRAGEQPEVRSCETVSRIISEALAAKGIAPTAVYGYYSGERVGAHLYYPAEVVPENASRIRDIASDALRLDLSITEPVNSGRQVRLILSETPRLSLEVYGASLCADRCGANGDRTCVFSDGAGATYILLSDGMGTGRPAAVESGIVVNMLRRLVPAGMALPDAASLVNTLMASRSGSEGFATLDCVKIDLETGHFTIMKSGAAATLLRQGQSVRKISAPTFPIGINECCEVYRADFDLAAGDEIIMFSDGISEAEFMFMKELLMRGGTMREIVEEITAKSSNFISTFRPDDVTVIGIRVVDERKKVQT